MVLVKGRLRYSCWQDKIDAVRFGCEVIAERVDFLSNAKAQADTWRELLFD